MGGIVRGNGMRKAWKAALCLLRRYCAGIALEPRNQIPAPGFPNGLETAA